MLFKFSLDVDVQMLAPHIFKMTPTPNWACLTTAPLSATPHPPASDPREPTPSMGRNKLLLPTRFSYGEKEKWFAWEQKSKFNTPTEDT